MAASESTQTGKLISKVTEAVIENLTPAIEKAVHKAIVDTIPNAEDPLAELDPQKLAARIRPGQ